MDVSVCYLCGDAISPVAEDESDSLSWDHVPPKQFYPKEVRHQQNLNLRLAPTHKRCNEAYREDEEYFYHALYIVVKDNNPRMGQVMHRDLARRVQKPQTPAMVRRLLNAFSPVTEGGIYLPPGMVKFTISKYRTQRIAIKIAQGLFCLDQCGFLPRENCKDIRICLEPNDVPELYGFLAQQTPPKTVCPEVFTYWHSRFDNVHCWSLLFWESLMFCTAFDDPSSVTPPI